MSSFIIALIIVALVLLLILYGVHIGVSLLATSVLGVWWMTADFSVACNLLSTGPFYVTFDYTLSVIPLFVLMGLFANLSGASTDLYRAGFAWFGRLPGGLGIVTTVANAVFAAVTGVSIASAAVFSKIAIPQMMRYGYSIRFSSGCVAGTSALGMLIPPSLILIVYGFLANESIGHLFIAAILPGIVLTINYSLMIILLAYFKPSILGNPLIPEKMSLMDRLTALRKASSIIFLVVLVLGGMYAGLFTPTEAGAVGCVGSVAVMIVKRLFNFKDLFRTLMDAGYTTASVFLLVIGAMMFGRMLAMSGLISDLSSFVAQADVMPILIVASICVILVLLGAFLDMVSILVISMPILLPVINQLGFDPIWFGIVVTLSIETGLVTPPFGMSVFVVKGSLGEKASLEDIYIGSLPFLLVLVVTVVLLLLFPSLATWLPMHM